MKKSTTKKKKTNRADVLTIGKHKITLGEQKSIDINVGTLPSGTKISIMAHVFRAANPGPCVLILAGVHGDEINGVEIVRRSLEDNLFDNLLCGTIIAIPLLNVYGFINFSRDVPDGKDVNRSFPGVSNGSLASRVARALTKHILPKVDFGVDFHTGGASRYNYPQIRYTRTDKVARKLAELFGPPFVIQKPMITKSLRKVAKDLKIPIIVYEGGESVRLDGFAIKKGYDGMKRLLKAYGMISKAPVIKHSMVNVTKTAWVRAPISGMFTWTRSSGVLIKSEEAIGHIKDPHGTKVATVISKRSGYIIGHNNASVVNQGDALFHIAYDYKLMI